ncbi:type I-U CRISPR-associated RAMP protein Csb1/Cas7u [Bifidobacterium simiarum]|uniref:type I-G CRISPR-associated RAMP protein Csb1/Cas7g n=1 Tax=Bifidobacterium simiarum TaxID=2045441 RepID=UPI001BDC48DC|nr:type I-U CRISPR-associated RAMP protein Csb1/Cas7u [Bifidobacterium simiarum]MBT1165783.1 type I-U CRISPR-associated protein Cas7 [Bifidobacterium simiarum]
MTRKLTLEDLNEAARLGGPSTLSEKTLLEPAAGEEGIVAPAKYTAGKIPTYIFEDRYVNGKAVRTVLIDSRTSQSNRLEAYITQAIKDGHSIFSKMPHIKVTYRSNDETGNEIERSYLEIQLPHRAVDAHIRIGTVNGASASEFPEYVNARNSTADNMMPLFELSPVTVAFGAWDATRNKNQLRIASSFNGEIIGVLANQDENRPVFRAGARVDPVAASINFDASGAKEIAKIIEPEISKSLKDNFEKEKKGSNIGLGAIPPSIYNGKDEKKKAYDGIAVSSIIRTHVLSFSTLRTLHFGKGPEGDAAIRVLIAAMIIDAMAGSNAELNLRANCFLRESAKPTTILDKRFGESEELSMITLEEADALLEQAYEQAHAKAGIDWHGQVLEVEGNPLVIKSGSDDEANE